MCWNSGRSFAGPVCERRGSFRFGSCRLFGCTNGGRLDSRRIRIFRGWTIRFVLTGPHTIGLRPIICLPHNPSLAR